MYMTSREKLVRANQLLDQALSFSLLESEFRQFGRNDLAQESKRVEERLLVQASMLIQPLLVQYMERG